MDNYILKTQINDNEPVFWTLSELFHTGSDAEILYTKAARLHSLMQCYFFSFNIEEPLPGIYPITRTDLDCYIGTGTPQADGVTWQCFTRQTIKAHLASNITLPEDWQGTNEAYTNLILSTSDDKLNDFLKPQGINIPAFDKPTSYRDTIKLLRITEEEKKNLSLNPSVNFIDAFDDIRANLTNHVPEVENSGLKIATSDDHTITFIAEAMVVFTMQSSIELT